MSDTTNFTPAVQKRLGVIEFIRLALMRWYIYVAVTVIFAIVTFVYSSAFITPLYQSTAKLYITSKDSNSTEANQFSISTILVKDFEEMVRDKIVLEGVVDELNNQYSMGQINSFITVNNPENTRIIEVTVRCPNPQNAKKIADSVCRISQEKLVDVMGLDRIKIMGEGDLPQGPCSPNVMRNVFMAVIFAVALVTGIVLISFFADNTVSDEKDIERYLGITALGSIPYNPKAKQSRSKKIKS